MWDFSATNSTERNSITLNLFEQFNKNIGLAMDISVIHMY